MTEFNKNLCPSALSKGANTLAGKKKKYIYIYIYIDFAEYRHEGKGCFFLFFDILALPKIGMRAKDRF